MTESTPKYRSVIYVDGVAMKECADCKVTKSVDEWIGWRTPDAKGRRYPNSVCKACRSDRVAGRRPRKTVDRPAPPEGEKWCPSCKKDLPLHEFSPRGNAEGHYSSCRPCVAKRNREARASMTPEQREAFMARRKDSDARNPLTRKRWNLRVWFNMTFEQYEDMYAEQGGVCAICRQPETAMRDGRVLDLAVDHDHACCPEKGRSCGKCIRALLCSNCNNAIGKMQDDPGRLMAAAAYLLRFAS